MIIKELTFKNIKSYGNKIQKIIFDEKGGLTLLTGTNGSGKSTIQEAIDLVVFNQVRGKESKKIPLKYFPNRINKGLDINVKFQNNNKDDIEINRTISPNTFKINVNNQSYTERYKLMNSTEVEELIGFNYDTFKSFISMSMNDFLNFISLKPEDKRNLLNKLFNLDEIDNYLSVTKEFVSQNKKEFNRLNNELLSIDSQLKDYMKIIKDNKNTKKSKYESKEEIKEEIKSVKKKFLDKQEEIKISKDKISNFEVNIQENKNKITIAESENVRRRTELIDIKNKIKIYDDGKCPHCSSTLTSTDHLIIFDELKDKQTEITEKILDNDDRIGQYKDLIFVTSSQKKVLNDGLKILDDEFIDIKTDAKVLKHEFDNFDEDKSSLINDIKKKGTELVKSKNEKIERITEIREDNISLTKLIKILGDDGARKTIISSIIPPINENLKKLLKYIKFPYDVKLNDNFDAEILDKNEMTHPELSSNGEIRMLNICIAISYLEMIRKNKNINILFMDEVFQSVQKDNINLILNLLKDFATKNKIHLFVVHHGLEEVDSKMFSRIISVQKSLFSDIKIY
jgi:DNA repair exonuclease SbcCD ATPase subunit